MAKKTEADPTGLRDRRAIGTRKIEQRLTKAEKAIRKLIKDLPFTTSTEKIVVNALSVVFDYQLDAFETNRLYEEIRKIINFELLETTGGSIMPPSWWWKNEIELPYRKGTVEQTLEFNKLINMAVEAGVTAQAIPLAAIPIELILTSPSYLSGLNKAYVDNFNQFKTFSDNTASKVIRELNNGMQSGLSRRDIGKNVAERFKVADSEAKRIANTEINKAYNDAKLKAIKDLGQSTGLNAVAMHISALSPTTRETHAARHNKVYSPTKQLSWWNSGSNRINCKCTVQSVLLDNEGNVINQELVRQIRE